MAILSFFGHWPYLARVIHWALSLFPYFALTKALVWSRGNYSVDALIWLMMALGVLAFAGAMTLSRRWAPSLLSRPSDRMVSLSLLLLGLWQSWRLVRHPHVLYAAPDSRAMALLSGCLWITLLCGAVALVGQWGRWLKRGSAPLLWGALAFSLLARGLVIFASPAPGVDVWTIGQEAVARLFAGINPYSSPYPDIYGGAFAYVPRLTYPPGYLLLVAPFGKLLGDIRWASVLAEALTLVGIYRLAGSKHLGRVAAWVWAVFPMGLLVVEQAWVDVLLAPFLVYAVLALRKDRLIQAGVLLGASVMVKQFGLGLIAFAAFWLWKRRGFWAAARFKLSAVATIALILVPWLIWDARGLWEGTVANIVSFAPRADALSWNAHWLRTVGSPLPIGSVGAVIFLALGGGVLLSLRRSSMAWVTGAAFFFLSVFLVSKQAFCNYYSWIALMLWLVVAERLRHPPSEV